VLQQNKLDALARWIGLSPAPLPPFSPIKPCQPKPEPLAECEERAYNLCGDDGKGYAACHKCVWSLRDDLIEQGCDFDGEHAAIVKFACAPKPAEAEGGCPL
jgi:hypothetical protein